MKPTLFLHIGCHRTATSSVQSLLASQRDKLRDEAVLYPFSVRRHHKVFADIFNGKVSADDVSADLLSQMNASDRPISTVILSDEDIAMQRDLAPLAAFGEHFEVKPVFSMRRQDIWLESWYFQNIKWQWNPALAHCTFDAFLAKRAEFHWIKYDETLARFAEAFGRENLKVNIFEKSQMPNGPLAAFCEAVGLPAHNLPSVPHRNASFSAEMVEFMRHLPLDQIAPKNRDILRQALEELDQKVLGNTAKQSELLMPYAQRQSIQAEYAEGNKAVAKAYFGRSELFLEPLPDKRAPLAKLELPRNSTALIERFVGPLLLHLAQDGYLAKLRN